MGATSIEWTDRTLNICRGCDAVSPGCLNCYAARMAARFAQPGEPFDGLAVLKDQPPTRDGQRRNKLAVWTDKPVTLVPDAMLEALSLRKPCKVFVCSMSDLFHADVPFEYIAAWWAFMAASPHVTYQIVTKRAERMREFFRWSKDHGGLGGWVRAAADLCRAEIAKPRTDTALTERWAKALRKFTAMPVSGHESRALPNVWLLVSAENQATLDERVPHLLACPAVVRGISAEPLLGPLDLSAYWDRLDWVIIGGESGPGARPFELAWARGIRDQRQQHAVAFGGGHTTLFLKQLGALPIGAGPLKDSHGGDESEWPADLQGLRAFPVPR